MVPLSALWLPVLLSAIIVFVASSIMHMLLPYHRGDCKRLPDEESIIQAMRSAGLKRGLYMFPYSTHKEMKSPEMAEKFKRGPVGMVTVFPSPGGSDAMGKYMAMWFVFCLVINFFVAYVTGRTVMHGAPYLAVFRVAGTVGFMTYGLARLSDGIWKGQPWGMTFKEVFDGLVFGLLTAGTFGWLWPR